MSDDAKFDAKIGSTFDKSGTDAAAEGLNKTKGAANDLKGTFLDVESAGKALKTAFLELFAITAVVAFFKDATTGAYENEKAMRSVATAALGYGMDVEKVKKSTAEWADEMARLSGVADNELTRALGEQLTLTGDLLQSQHRVGLAMDLLSSGKARTFTEAMGIVNAVIHGQTRVLIGVIPGVTKHTEASEAQALGQKFLEGTIKGTTAALSDNAAEIDRGKIRWEQFKESVGGVVLNAVRGLRDAILDIPSGLREMGSAFRIAWDEIKERAGVVGVFLRDVWKGPGTAFAEYQKGMAAASIHSQEAMAKSAVDAETAKQAALKKLTKAGADETLQVDNLVKKAKKETIDENIQYKVEEFEKERRINDKRITEARRVYLEIHKLMREAHEEFLTNKEKEATAEERAFANARAQAAQILAVKKAAQQAELAGQTLVANSATALMGAMFGESKELSIAQAVVNTYLGATQALAQTGIYGPIAAALIIAFGMAQVAKIASTEPAGAGGAVGGSGFDDPSNDRAAYMGGRKWAGDMIREFSGGAASVSSGWAAGMGGSTTNDNSRTTNINVSGGLIDPNSREWMKQFGRRLAVVMNADGQRAVARKT